MKYTLNTFRGRTMKKRTALQMVRASLRTGALMVLGLFLLTSCMGRTAAFHRAVKEGRADRIKASLDANPRLLQAQDYDGWTPLHTASFFGRSDIVRLLISKGANANAMDKSGETPLHLVAAEGSIETAGILISAGARIDAKTLCGWTPLHNAVMENRIELAQFLISKGAHVNEPNNELDTPLALAEKLDREEMAQMLRSAGARK